MPDTNPYLWGQLLSAERKSKSSQKEGLKVADHRTEFERDFDRVVFSTPVRRLKDKTQVFPLDMHDGVRTRLTHSMEVSNLARSMGVAVAEQVKVLGALPQAIRNIPSLLATIALAHDLGNPPFGHQGEEAIRAWVKAKEQDIKKCANDFNADLFKDFLYFEGNAQGFRILTRLQHVDHDVGLNLTAGTLRAFMKYPWHASNMQEFYSKKKFGCFASERDIFEWANEQTGLVMGARHPLSFLMEICDDIAYSVLDIEDGVKKELITSEELIGYLCPRDECADERIGQLRESYRKTRDWLMTRNLRSHEVRDAQIEIFRTIAIGFMVSDAIERFGEIEASDEGWKDVKDIAGGFRSTKLIEGLKAFAQDRIYRHHDVIRAELPGHTAIPKLMDVIWRAINSVAEEKASKVDEYVYSMLSKNYVRVYEQSSRAGGLPGWYRRLQLLCDQICGMTDSYALRLHDDLAELSIV